MSRIDAIEFEHEERPEEEHEVLANQCHILIVCPGCNQDMIVYEQPHKTHVCANPKCKYYRVLFEPSKKITLNKITLLSSYELQQRLSNGPIETDIERIRRERSHIVSGNSLGVSGFIGVIGNTGVQGPIGIVGMMGETGPQGEVPIPSTIPNNVLDDPNYHELRTTVLSGSTSSIERAFAPIEERAVHLDRF